MPADTKDEAYKNIGKYIVLFSHIETAVDNAILSIFDLSDKIFAPSIVKKIPFIAKVEIIIDASKHACDVHGKAMNDDWKRKTEKVCNQIKGIAETTRNRLAHDHLAPEASGLVKLGRTGPTNLRSEVQDWDQGTWDKHIASLVTAEANLKSAIGEVNIWKYEPINLGIKFGEVNFRIGKAALGEVEV